MDLQETRHGGQAIVYAGKNELNKRFAPKRYDVIKDPVAKRLLDLEVFVLKTIIYIYPFSRSFEVLDFSRHRHTNKMKQTQITKKCFG